MADETLMDAVVIGAGPAGLAAAECLTRHGAATLLLDGREAAGGQCGWWSGWQADPEMIATRLAAAGGPGSRYLRGAGVWQVTPSHEVWFSVGGASQVVASRLVILATGAMERPVPVPGATLRGAISIGQVGEKLRDGTLSADEPLVLAGSGPLFFQVAERCLSLGANLAAILDTTPWINQITALAHLPGALRPGAREVLAQGLAFKRVIERGGVPLYRHVRDLSLAGDAEVAELSFHGNGLDQRLATHLVALHEGVIPAQHVPRSVGAAYDWDRVRHCFCPRLDLWGMSSVDGIYVAGDAAGIGGAAAAQNRGALAALDALHRLGLLDAAQRDTAAAGERTALARHLAARPFLDRLFNTRKALRVPADAVALCPCEDVSAGAVRSAVRAAHHGPDQVKALLRCGMGPCQGRLCGPVVSEVIASELGRSPAEIGYFRVRPPLRPLRLEELAGMELEA